MLILSTNKTDLIKAKNLLKTGELIAFPTETVMGLGIIYNDEIAFNKINKVLSKVHFWFKIN